MKQYLELIQTIKNKGTIKPAARENMPGTTSLFGYQFRHDLAEGFPLLTTKKLNFKHIIVELLWFLKGDTNVKYLVDNGCNIWNQDAYNYYLKLHKSETGFDGSLSFESFVSIIKDPSSNKFGLKATSICENRPDYNLGDCGVQYGELWRDLKGVTGDGLTASVDQLKNLISGLKNSPMSRRHIIDAWNPLTLNDMALNACHCLVQFNCRPLTSLERSYYAVNNSLLHRNELMFPSEYEDKTLDAQLDEANVPKYYLDCQMYQRSADVFLGVPYNIASYSLLTEMLSKMCNMVPGDFVHSFGDVHIYDNHQDQINEQLTRKETKLPTLKLGSNVDWNSDINTLISSINLLPNEAFDNLFKLEGYNPQARIKGELSTGLK